MDVTITLGQKAKEFVTGIPEEELPEILADVLERSLLDQVRPLTSVIQEKDNSKEQELLLAQLKDLVLSAGSVPISMPQREAASIDIDFSKATQELVVNKVEDTDDEEIDLEEFDFFK